MKEVSPEAVIFPPVLDVCSGGPNTKVCPFMHPQIVQMPVNPPKTALATPGQPTQIAYVRQYTPCIGAACMAWVEPVGAQAHCRLFEGKSL